MTISEGLGITGLGVFSDERATFYGKSGNCHA